MMWRVLFVELGMYGHRHLERQAVGRGEAISKDYARNEAALDTFAVFNGYITTVDKGLFLSVSLRVNTSATAKQGYQGLNRNLA